MLSLSEETVEKGEIRIEPKATEWRGDRSCLKVTKRKYTSTVILSKQMTADCIKATPKGTKPETRFMYFWSWVNPYLWLFTSMVWARIQPRLLWPLTSYVCRRMTYCWWYFLWILLCRQHVQRLLLIQFTAAHTNIMSHIKMDSFFCCF